MKLTSFCYLIANISFIILMVSCASPRPQVALSPSLIDGLAVRQLTPAGTIVISLSGLSDQRLRIVDEKVYWCITNGLKAGAADITIYVKDGVADETGTRWIMDNSQKIGGKTLSFRPITIIVMPNQLGCIRHELLHVHLYQTTGDCDPNHTRPEWKIWPTYEET